MNAKKAKPDRTASITDLLRRHPSRWYSAKEIMAAVGAPKDHAKFFSSTLLRMFQRGVVDRHKSEADGAVFQFRWNGPAAGAGAKADDDQAAGPKARKSRAKSKTAGGADWTRTQTGPTAEERAKARAEHAEQARRKAEEERKAGGAGEHSRRRQPTWFTADQSKVFERLTGCKSRDQAEMKAAYRAAALKFHPDRDGGDEEKFKGLASAWTSIKRTRGWK